MAIAKISRPRRAGATIGYLLQAHDHRGRQRATVSVIASTIGRTSSAAAGYLGAISRLRPRLKRHLYHVSISVPASERELSTNEWAAIGRCWCEGMGLQNYMIVLHDAHIHILSSRIRADGTAASDRWDYRRSELLLRKIEIEFDLPRTLSSHLVKEARRSTHSRARSLREIRAISRDGASNKDFIRRVIDSALSRSGDEAHFTMALAEQGIDMTIKQREGAKASVLFGFRGRLWGPRALGRGYGLAGLVAKGLQISSPRYLSGNLPKPPWAACHPPEIKQSGRAGHHEEAVKRLRRFAQDARRTIIGFRDQGGPNQRPGSGLHGPEQEGADKPPDVT